MNTIRMKLTPDEQKVLEAAILTHATHLEQLRKKDCSPHLQAQQKALESAATKFLEALD